jgi:bacterial/archaeal transporter family-2 protein
MNAGWIIPFIILGGALQTCGAAMNGQLKQSLVTQSSTNDFNLASA